MDIKKMHLQNFKGAKDLTIDFGKKVLFSGANATGKTTVMDAFYWLLFGTNSHGDSEQKFDVRELDQDGNTVHFSEILVSAVVEVNGNDIEIEKTQAEKWTKKRGQEEQVFSGNVNSYKINGFPKSKSEYEKFISEIIDGKLFRILSSPYIFPEMDWKEQRKILLGMVNISPEEIGKTVDYFDSIANDIAIETPDAVKKKYTLSKNKLKKEQEQIPVEIGALNQQIKEVDLSGLEEREFKIAEAIEDINRRIAELDFGENNMIDSRIINLQQQQRIIISSANDKRNTNIRSANNEYQAVSREKEIEDSNFSQITNSIRRLISQKTSLEKMIDVKRATYKQLAKSEFPEDEAYCDKCGQKLPEGKIADLKAVWEQRKADRLKQLEKEGKSLAEELEIANKNYESEKAEYDKSSAKVSEISERLDKASKALEAAQNQPAVIGTELPEYMILENEIRELDSNRKSEDEIMREIESLKSEKVEKEREAQAINDIKSQENFNNQLRSEIDRKNERLKEVALAIAQCDKCLFALESYIKKLSGFINSNFDGLKFKLFSEQINGGISDCCEITWDGIPYRSLNNGHRILAGLNIIKTLQKYYGVSVPVWVDNAESLSDLSAINVDSQLILLKVSEDKKLVVSEL